MEAPLISIRGTRVECLNPQFTIPIILRHTRPKDPSTTDILDRCIPPVGPHNRVTRTVTPASPITSCLQRSPVIPTSQVLLLAITRRRPVIRRATLVPLSCKPEWVPQTLAQTACVCLLSARIERMRVCAPLIMTKRFTILHGRHPFGTWFELYLRMCCFRSPCHIVAQ